MKNQFRFPLMLALFFSLFAFIQCSSEKKQPPAEGTESNGTAEDDGNIVNDKPRVYLVAVVADPTTEGQCVDGLCSSLTCQSPIPNSVDAEAGYENYTLCVCFQNCANNTSDVAGFYSYDGGVGLGFNSKALESGEGKDGALGLGLESATTKDSSGNLVFTFPDGETMNSYTINFK